MGTDGVKTAAEFQALLRGEKGECMFNACIFQYVGCDFANNLIGCKRTGECLCCVQDACCIPGAEPYKVGVLPNKGNKEKFRAGLHCCEFAIKPPEVLALSEGRCFVLHDAAAFPFAGPVPVPVCALYGLRCLPGPIATCGAPPEPAASLLQVTVEEKKSDGAGGPPASEMER